MNFLFAWRYFKSKKTTNAINIIAWISVVAIGVVTASLIIVFSVFNGFEDLVKGLYSDFYADIRISAATGKVIHLTQVDISKIKSSENIVAFTLTIEEKALLMNEDNQSIAFVKGVDNNYAQVNNVAEKIIRGKFNTGTPASPRLILGAGIENALRVDIESGLSPMVINLPNRKAAKFNAEEGFNSFNVYPSGTFRVQQEFDDKYVFTNIAFLRYMLNMGPDDFTAVELKLASDANPEEAVLHLKNLLGNKFLVQSRYQQNQNLYSAMQVEKWVIYGITCLIFAVAAFNVIGSLTMLVLEKQKDIAVLKAMGADTQLIKNIFLSEGILLASIGGTGGAAIATIVCLGQYKFHIIKLEGGSFLIDYYPVQLLLTDYLIVLATVIIITVLAAFIPARKASTQLISLKS